jgi:predicted DNA-binding transcriptional regulator AlpA
MKEITVKNAYTIEDLMTKLGVSRPTIFRYRKKGIIPKPDVDTGHPIWFKATLDAALPNLTTNP